ncbi:hypothetical protein SFRURICE_018864 [Spodoptera frugiperda]|nr:hypothetical protein SFRURICE_018864 [Spodoptera frugiperda]
MSERGARRGPGAPFYAPLRRKTSAEIISEARAAIYGEMSGTSSGGGAGGGLRPLRTRRPYTPREPQRSLYTNKKEPRPPSGFDLKFLSLSESGEETLAAMDARIAHLDEEALNEMLTDTRSKKKPPYQGYLLSSGGCGLELRCSTAFKADTQTFTQLKPEAGLAGAISVTRPLGDDSNTSMSSTLMGDIVNVKADGAGATKRKQFAATKAASCDVASCTSGLRADIDVKHLAVQLPNTSSDSMENMTLLELSEALSQRCRDPHRTLQLLEAVVANLQATTPGGSLRELLTRALYMHIDSDDERILVAVARAMLSMRVTGTHLAAACKLVFKIAKNDKNDIYFKTTNLLELLVEGCGRAEPVSEAGCCVYGCAALRVLALEPALCARAVAAGAAHLAALHLKILNNAKAECPRSLGEQSTHALYQVTGALRSLAGAVDRCARDFLASGALPELVNALALHTDRDVLTNVARCLSVVSGSAECCAWLCACGGAARAVLRALAACAPRAPLAVRLAYTLGNMAAADERARNDIYNEDGAIDVLLTILESYTKKNPQDMPDVEADPDLHLVGSDLGGSDGSNEDVLIKTVRVVANLCLAERVGRGLADIYAQRIVNSLLACLQLAEKYYNTYGQIVAREHAPCERARSLATARSPPHNLTFLPRAAGPARPTTRAHRQYLQRITVICPMSPAATCRWLRGSGPASCEAVRALGNVSRATRTAQLIVLEGALDRLEPFLNHEDGSVRGSAARGGVAARALAAAAAHRDTAPAPLLARALWNAHAHHQYPLSPIHAHAVSEALAVFIDDESVFAACEADKLGEQEIDRNVTKHHVTFDLENNNYASECDPSCYDTTSKRISRKNSLETGDVTGEDLGFEEGDVEECWCDPCRRLATWDELVGVAIPLLDRLRPPRTDASVGTE